MVRLWALICILFISTAAEAQSTRIDGGDVVAAGLMRAEVKAKVVQDKSISTGQRVDYPEDPKVYKRTTSIAVKGETIFGIEARINGSPQGRDVKLTVVWLYPEPGIKAPGSSSARYKDSYDATHALGETASYYWTLDEGYAKVPGIWTVELWNGERRLVKQEFTMEP